MIVFITPPSHQKGVATLVLSIIILIIISFVSLYTAKSVITETKITNNTNRSKLAFEAAEAGLAVARDKIKKDALDPGITLPEIFFYDESGSNVISSVIVTYNNNLQIISTGYSDDKSIEKTITFQANVFDPISNPPENPFTSKGSINLSGSAQIYNQEGASTVWTGGGSSGNGSYDTYIANPTDTGYPDCMENSFDCSYVKVSDNSTGAGVDFIENDTTLANLTTNEFFANFTGYSINDFKNFVVSPDGFVTSIPDGSFNKVFWVDVPIGGTFSINGGVYGCNGGSHGNPPSSSLYRTDTLTYCESQGGVVDPVLIVVDGDMFLNGGYIYGAVLVLGDFEGGGNGDVIGALMVNGDTIKGVGGISIWYNSDVLELIGSPDSEAIHAVSGGWRDFE